MNFAVPVRVLASKRKLTRKALEAILASHPVGQRGRYWFEDNPGLYLSISKRGCATYYLRYRKLSGQKADFAIGPATLLTPQEARDKARDSLADLTLNYRDPVEARREAIRKAQAAPTRTFRVLKEDFLAAAEIRALAPRTVAEWEWVLEKHVLPELGDLEASTIKRRDVKDCLRAIQKAAGQKVPDHPKYNARGINLAQGGFSGTSVMAIRMVISNRLSAPRRWKISESLDGSRPLSLSIFSRKAMYVAARR